MRLAMARAREGIRRGQTPFGAVIVKNGRVVACEHNVVWRTRDITAHAEVHAIRQACRKLRTVDLSGTTLYSTCEPCPMCFSASHWARIGRIVYGATIADARRAGFHELEIAAGTLKSLGKSPVNITRGFLRAENVRLFTHWQANPRHRVY